MNNIISRLLYIFRKSIDEIKVGTWGFLHDNHSTLFTFEIFHDKKLNKKTKENFGTLSQLTVKIFASDSCFFSFLSFNLSCFQLFIYFCTYKL